ncbi:MAG: thioesterase family protein [Acidimicrobiales bacterium]|nr:thioesterase family protein [Acidimicrobiales bacterium]
MLKVDHLVAGLALEPTGPDRYRAPEVETGHEVIFGGQLLAQSLVAASIGHEGKRAKTIHTVFARGAAPGTPLDVAVETMHGGRAFASSTVTISQGDRLCTRSLVLLTADEPDFIHHADPAPTVGAPPETPASGGPDEWQVQIVGDVDISDPELTGPAELDVWTRFPGAPDDLLTAQAVLAFASDGFLIGTAMRPHAGVGQSQAHDTLATGVVSHTLTFHEPFPADDWLLLAHRSPHAGHGRSYGRADVFTPAGALVASYVQDAMLRPMPAKDPGRG